MNLLTETLFSFTSSARPDDTFDVIGFTGFEGLSRMYEFEIRLVSRDPDIDLDDIIRNTARLVIHREDGDVPFNGILQTFEFQGEYQGHGFYRAVLSPKLWWLTLSHHNQVFLDMTVPEIITKVLRDGGLDNTGFALRLTGSYSPMDYVCQYGESHFSFLSRWLEREGMYYFFEQGDGGEKLVIADSKVAHVFRDPAGELRYSPASGLEALHTGEIIRSLTSRQRPLPAKVILRDYNPERPSLDISGSADVAPEGRGEVYLYGEHFLTPAEGNRLAKIRAEELACRRREYYGESTAPLIMPGFLFTLAGHPRGECNQDYLIEEVTHDGSQTAYLISGLSGALTDQERTAHYRNSFKAIPSGAQYRPERTAQKPRISGTLNARVESAGSGAYADLDGQGRYLVQLPFDVTAAPGKGSARVRMAQPYAGSDRGMHFPLRKGTEVLLTFIDGDPDRPVIAGALPNPETPSVVNSASNASGGFSDGANNFIMHNSDAGQRITMSAGPQGGSAFFSMGTGSPPGAISQSDYESRNSYYFTNSGLAQSVIGAWSQNMTAQSVLWALIRLLSKHICDTILEHDRIGKKTGAIDEDDNYKGIDDWHMALIAGGPIVLSVILTAQMSFSLARHLLKKVATLPMANFGLNAIELHAKLMADSGWISRIRKAAAAGILDTISNALTGWSGTYGVVIFNNTNSLLGGLLNPTAGSGVKLNPRKADILISSGYGFVDIDAAKDVTLSATKDIVLEGMNILMDAPGKVMIGGGSVGKAAVVVGPDGLTASSVVLESGFSTVTVCGDVTQPKIELIATRAPLVPIKQSIIMDDISVFIGNNTIGSYIQADQIGVMVSSKTGNIQVSGMMGTIEATTQLTLEGKVATNIGSASTAQVNINAAMLSIKGKIVDIGSDSILKAQGAMIQLG